MIARVGQRRFMWAFSALSVLFFGWIWMAFRAASAGPVFWVTSQGERWASAALMLGAFLQIFSTGLRTGRVTDSYGTAVGIWGLVHMANNAAAADWVFFGYMTLLALAGTWLIDHRRARLLGDAWPPLKAETSNLPFLAILRGRNRLLLREFGWARAAAALAAWALALWVHETVFGLPVLWF